MSGHHVNLTRHQSDFVDLQIKIGRHDDASEVVREALRRYEGDLEDEQAGLAALGAVAERGVAAIERGDYVLVRGADGSRELLERLTRCG